MLMMISAKTARRKAEDIHFQDELNIYTQEISKAVNQGKTSTYYFSRISDYVKERLEKLGYTVIIKHSDYSDDGYVTYIYW